MKLLAIDTCTDACSCALAIGNEITERYELAPRQHAALMLPMVDNLLNEADLRLTDLDGLAFGCGPGSFTGVRLGTGIIQGLAFGANLAVAPVSSLAALAQGLYREKGHKNVLTAFDARMQEIYWGAWQLDANGLMQAAIEPDVGAAIDVRLPDTGIWHGAGSGWGPYGELLQQRLADRLQSVTTDCLPHARDIALLAIDVFNQGNAVSAEQALPVYLRNKVARKPNE